MSALPKNVAAQGLGVPADNFASNIESESQTFLPLGPVPQGSLEEFRASIALPPQQSVPLTHRFQLADFTPQVCSDLVAAST